MKGTRFTKFISLLLSVMMVLTLLPSSALAEVTEEPSVETPVVTNGDATEEETGEDPVVKYTVNFYVGNDLFDTQEVADGSNASRPSDPAVPAAEAEEGMSFLYWYAKNKNTKFYFDTPITEDLDLHALFGVVEEPAEEPAEEPVEEPVTKSSVPGAIIPGETFLKTYTFMLDGAQYGETQTVATGDTLYEPAAPTAPAGMQFVGWFDGSTQFTSFGTQTVEANGDITLTAVFASAYYAFFYNAAGTAIIETRAPGTDNLVSTTNVTALQIAVDEALIGWSLTPGGSVVGSTVTVSGANVNLYPIIQKVKWISFNSNGGTYVSPMYVAPNTVLTSAMVNAYVDSQVEGTQITKPGYTFGSWTGFTFGNTVTADVTLNATWTANTNTPYKLVYWIENADDSNYSFEKTVVKTGTSGAAITPNAAELSTDNLNSSYKTYFNTGTYTPGTTINGDGSSIVNIYHTRKTYTLTFRYDGDNIYSGTYKYDQDISAVWAVAAIKNLLDAGYVWKSSLTNAYYSFLQKMPGSSVTMTATKWSGYLHMWYYYLETLDGTAATAPAGAETTTSGGITYYKSRTVTIYGSAYVYLTYAEDYYPITGFTQRDGDVPDFTYHEEVGHWEGSGKKKTWVVDQEEYYDASLFYRRSSYSLTFINGDTTNTISNIKYEASIQNQNYTPTRPTGVPTNFVFMGWYTTEGAFAGSEFTWAGKTMPAKNLVLYASWQAPSFTGIAHLTVYGTGGGTYDLGTIPYGGTISASALEAAQAEAELYKPHTTDTFGGWLIERNGSRTLFNASMQIYEDVVLYPQWISGVSYNVTYDLNGAASGTAPVDATAYGAGAQAQVLAYDASVVPPTGMVFIGWLGSDGHIYYPGSAITITDNTTLTAQWSSSASAVTLTYNGNGGKRSDDSTTYDISTKNNTRHTVETNTFSNTGKKFVKWNTKADGSGTDYLEGASVLLSASQPSSPTTLYAIWEAVAYYTITVIVNPPEGITDYDGDGTYPEDTNAHFIHWDVADGYYITSVYDNGVLVDPIAYSGNKLQIHKIDMDHEIIINLAPTSYTLTYDGNGGTYSGGSTSTSTLEIGGTYVVPANFFTNTGNYFTGWSTSSSGPADPAYAPGTTHTMPANDVTLYAIWAAKTNLVLTANGSTVNYNGSAQSVSGFTGSISGLTYGGTTTAGVSGTNPGQYTATFANTSGLIITQSGTDVTDRYNVSFVTGTLTINPRVSYINEVTGAEYAYEWVAYGTGDATYSITPAKNVTVGTTNYYWTGTWDIPAANDLIANTTITALYSLNKTLTITGDSDTFTYNGSEQEITTATLSDPTLTVTGYTVSGKGTNAASYDVEVTLGSSFKIMSGTTDVTYQYDVETVKGTLTIDPATLTVTAVDKEITYPAARPAETTLNYTVGGEIGSEDAAFTGILGYASTLGTNPLPGLYANVIEQGTLLLADNGSFLASNYSISFVKGDLNVLSGTFSVSLTDASAVYDGSAHSATLNGTQSGDDIQYFIKEGGVWIPVSYTPSVTNVNDGPKEIKVIVSRTGYTNAEATATLTITPATLTVTAVDKEITYPAARPAEATLNYTASGNVSGETPAYTGTLAYQTGLATNPAAGSYPDVIEQGTLALADSSTFKASNYTLSFVKGDLTVLAGTMTPTSSGYIGTYDGDPHGLTADVPGVTGEIIYYSTSPDGPFDSTTPPTFTDAGTYTVYFMATDPAGNYNDSSVYSANVVITPAILKITATTQIIVYPEERPAESSLSYSLSSGNVSGETPAYSGILSYVSGLATNPTPDTYVDAIEQGTLTLVDNGSFLASNYTLSFTKGDLIVGEGYMFPESAGYTGVYDGVAHGLTAFVAEVPGAEITYSTSADGIFTSEAPTFTDVGTYKVFFRASDPAGNYFPSSVVSADVVITPATLTVTAKDKEITYPADRPAEATLDYTASGNVSGETPAYTGTLAYQTGLDTNPLPGLYTDAIEQGTLALADSSTFKASNYAISFVEGDLNVLSGTFSVSLTDASAVYNGSAHYATLNGSVSSDDIQYFVNEGGVWLPISYTPSVTNVSDGPKEIKVLVSRTGYTDAEATATLTITPVEVTVTADDRSMTYGDTMTLTPAEGVTYAGFVNSETSSVVSGTGSITYTYKDGATVVAVDNTLDAGSYAIVPGVGGLSATNYTFVPANGTLTVEKADMTPTSTGYSDTYDGDPHGLTASVTEVPGAVITYSDSATGTFSETSPAYTDAGTYEVFFKAVDPDGNYNDSDVYSAFVNINKRYIDIVTYPATKVYDGTPLTNPGWEYGPLNEGFVKDEGFLSSGATGTQTNAGSTNNPFAYVLNGSTLLDNYTIAVTESTLTVYPRSVVVILDAADKNFGDADPAFTFHYLTVPGLYDILPGTGVTLNLIRTDAALPTGEDVGVHTGVLSISVDYATPEAAGNYIIVPGPGDFTIHPQVTYNVNTLDAVTGFPATEWFDYLTDATFADATGVARLGYVLTGWTDDLTGAPVALGETITGIDRNYSLSAVWELMTYSIFYLPNTAMAVANMPGTQTDVPYTSLATMSGLVPTRAGFTFVHWDTADIPGSISLDPGSAFPMPNNDVTFVAIWEPDLTPVYYHANGGQGGTVEDGPFATLTLVTVAGNGFTRPGYRFIGWSTTPNGAVSAQPGDTFMMPILQVNYYAQWEQELYTVTYIVNGGTEAGLDGAVPYAEYTNLVYGDAMPVPADPAQDGYTFDGWTTAIPATVPEGGLTIYGSMTAVTIPPEIITEEPTPLAGASWALLNLILAIATALGSVLMLIGLVGKKRKEEVEGVVVRETMKHPVTRLMTLLPAIGGIIAFILTENMKNPMAIVDRWTILMAVIAVLQIALVLLGVKKDKDVDPETTK